MKSLAHRSYGKSKLVRELWVVLGLKGLLCLASLATIALAALAYYQASVTITPVKQFNIGATSASWSIYINDIDEIRYLPGGTQRPSQPSDSNPNTFAFKVMTDSDRVCAVKIELTAAVDSTKFSKFQITIMRWDESTSTWIDETLYGGPTGSTTKPYIDGLASGDAGYIHHGLGTTRYYLVKVTYSYDKTDATDPMTVTFQYTPLPQGSF